MSFTKGDRIFN